MLAAGSVGYNALFNCTTPAGAVLGVNRAVCKSGPPQPMAPAPMKNVLYIGDSLSFGFFESGLKTNLSDIAKVSHAPWGQDGGAEETAYGVYCLDFFTRSPSGMETSFDVIMFNCECRTRPAPARGRSLTLSRATPPHPGP